MAVIPTQSTVKPKLPYEKEPGPASPYVNTAPDIRTSEQISKGSPVPSQTTQVAAVPGAGTLPAAPTAPTAVPGQSTVSSTTSAAPAAPPTAAAPKPAAASAVPAAATPTVTSPGAPPGTPDTKPATPLAPTPKSIVGKTAAEQEKEQAENEYNRKLYEAALLQTENDEGTERQAEGSLRGLTGRMGNAGTVNSSLFGEGKGLISTARAVSISKALDAYNKSVREAQDFLTKAQTAYNRAMEQKSTEEAEAGRRNEPKEAGPEPPPPPAPEPGATPQTPQGGHEGQTQGAAEHPGEWVGGVRVGYVPQVKWSRDPKVRERQSKEIAEGKLKA